MSKPFHIHSSRISVVESLVYLLAHYSSLAIAGNSIYHNNPFSNYSASSGATGAVSLTWIPPRFFSLVSWKGSFQPPSSSGVLNHNLMRWRRGAGGGKSLYAVRACSTWLFDKNWMSPMSRIICSASFKQVASSTSAARSCASDSAGIRPALEKRVRDLT